MIDLYTWPTPNGHKIHIMLEECKLPYRVHPVNIGTGDQFKPDFLAIDVRDLTRPEAAAWRAAGHPLLTWTVRSPDTRAAGLALADALIAEGEGLA